ncbi:PREDICTED: multiple epidermal growth factor-like domains protein 10 [Rhagoletis zephyria]|uniref:multiple epidermal growth factor-like domains protein 10 n=1 Tax=Rhagoletis zephyria TaxID=28612 RepID=UPI00081174EE|nr:PREDICTED: multiple epidermal growth factor-like domains protein 10 [Rhagoletis zephyria]
MEVSCIDDDQCVYYEAEDINSICLNGICHCHNNKTNMKTFCKPKTLRRNNIIGGNCPCKIPDAKCNLLENICYCIEDYVPTKDRRRCIPKEVPLGEICATDEQCLASSIFSHCANNTNRCTCNDDFQRKGTTCLAKTAPKVLGLKCTVENNCTEHGSHKICLQDIDECVCEQGYVRANDSKDCLPGKRIGENCVVTQQCNIKMGPGAVCEDGKCRCEEEYAVVKKQSDASPKELICERLVQIGQYCSHHGHCHNGHLIEKEQLLQCEHGECVCRFGNKNQEPCSTSMANRVMAYNICSWLMLAAAVLHCLTLGCGFRKY